MDALKIQTFQRDHGGTSFPRYEVVDSKRVDQIRAALARALGMQGTVDPLLLVQAVQRAGVPLPGNAADADFELTRTLESAGIVSLEHVYINWYRYDALDRMRLDDLSQVFSDVWYPASDDIDLLDDSLSWILSISHDGVLTLSRLREAAVVDAGR